MRCVLAIFLIGASGLLLAYGDEEISANQETETQTPETAEAH